MSNLKVCNVGYALNPKKLRAAGTSTKWNGGGLSDIVSNSSEDNSIKFIEWKPEIAVIDQPVFDVLIHKLTEDIDRPESAEKMNALSDYLAFHPNTVIVDEISHVRKVISRSLTCHHLNQIEKSMALTHRWLIRSKEAMTRKESSLFGIIQGGLSLKHRML